MEWGFFGDEVQAQFDDMPEVGRRALVEFMDVVTLVPFEFVERDVESHGHAAPAARCSFGRGGHGMVEFVVYEAGDEVVVTHITCP